MYELIEMMFFLKKLLFFSGFQITENTFLCLNSMVIIDLYSIFRSCCGFSKESSQCSNKHGKVQIV